MFEDFLSTLPEIFDKELAKNGKEAYYETNLKDLFKSLHIPWDATATGGLDVSADYTRTYTTPISNASTTVLKGKLVKVGE